jgi:ATP-dependent DNA ligase
LCASCDSDSASSALYAVECCSVSLRRARVAAPSACRFHPACSAAARDEAAAWSRWIHEIKFDGYRLIARKDPDRVVLWSRYATDYSATFSRIAEAIRALPFDHVMIDGEAVVFPDGRVSIYGG